MPSQQTFKEILARKIPDVIAFLIWLILSSKRRLISDLLNDTSYLQKNFKTKSLFVWVNFGAIVTIAVPTMSWFTVTLPFDENGCRSLLEYYTLGLFDLPQSQNCKIVYFIMAWNQFAVYTLRACVVVLYVILCCLMKKLLNAHSESGWQKILNRSTLMDYNYFHQYLAKHDHIIDALKSLEKILSFPIFLIQIIECFTIFYRFVIRDYGAKQSWVKNFSIGIVFDSTLSLVSFLCVSFAASSVHEASKNAKDVQEKMLKQILASGQQRNSHELLLLFVTHTNPPFTLSAFGFFYFTKGMILSAIGSVLTYSLLIIQILK
ncbi:hypothetical protein AVEN_124245-1 [Araneus ventricosus]|uniref:Gustatory receptor n=1 Tax=Araneus ventricosus TaxID=182803 RepID=A0A4Y2N3P4_ARAVE|nr:hypothetical protein AVEN_124245-1 [Araneus ventricosus]